ncbi:MAG: hypothetical protein LBO64_09870 [Desulfovibrio sp.]|jgi:rhodanese-related sulfurtransferase|nr:hypothetical protein [Desulfovibrio sp.]
MKTLSAQLAKKRLQQDEECALIDVREQEEFSRGHPLLASCLSLSRLELEAEALIPCKKTTVIVTDSGVEPFSSPRAECAAKRLTEAGYADVIVLAGGVEAWKKAGYLLFTGVGALSKAFGELVEVGLDTKRLDPEEVKHLLDAKTNTRVVDVRPWDEYHTMNIPGSVNLPGCEVTYRIADAVPDPETLIVINCAGRTRSIIGAQTLINAGLPNKVAALKGGTMNWSLAGLELEYGSVRVSPPPSPAAFAIARRRAAQIAKKYNIAFADAATLAQWQAQAQERTLYLFDIRQPEEFMAGHIPGSRNAPGGQLVQATDEYATVRKARFVLVDDTEVRAIMTAHWLKQMGLEQVFVLKGGLAAADLLVKGSATIFAPNSGFVPPKPDTLTPWQLRALTATEPLPLILNIGGSRKHRAGHIPGAAWVMRAYLERARAACPDARNIVITSDSQEHAAFAWKDARVLWQNAQILCLTGGASAWEQAGLPLEQGMDKAFSQEEDIWYKPYEDIHANREAMSGYFAWESKLVEQVRKDGSVTFALAAE